MNRLRHFVKVITLILPLAAFADAGKLAGTVLDENKEGAIGASVQVIETQQGAAVKLDGSYVILGVEPGKYTVRMSFVGYATQTYRDVVVNSNQTTTLNATLVPEAVQLGERVIEWKEPPVKLVGGQEVHPPCFYGFIF